jgi:hypothetical protein
VLAGGELEGAIGAPASAVIHPSPTSMIARAREVSSTSPPGMGIAWP